MTTLAVTNPASTILQDASTAGQPSDANTVVTSTPAANAPATRDQAQPTIAGEHQAYLDAWATNPTQDAPVRTWLDASQRDTPDGQYLAAWHDTPASGDTNAPVTETAPLSASDNASANAAAISGMQAQAQAATAAQAAANPPPSAPYVDVNQTIPGGIA